MFGLTAREASLKCQHCRFLACTNAGMCAEYVQGTNRVDNHVIAALVSLEVLVSRPFSHTKLNQVSFNLFRNCSLSKQETQKGKLRSLSTWSQLTEPLPLDVVRKLPDGQSSKFKSLRLQRQKPDPTRAEFKRCFACSTDGGDILYRIERGAKAPVILGRLRGHTSNERNEHEQIPAKYKRALFRSTKSAPSRYYLQSGTILISSPLFSLQSTRCL